MIVRKQNAGMSLFGLALIGSTLCADPVAIEKQISGKKDITVRYLDSLGAMRESKDGQIVGNELESKRKKMTEELQKLEQKLMAAAKEFQEKAAMMSEDAREKEQKTLVKMERDFKLKAQEFDEEFKVAMQKATEKLSKEVDEAVQVYARNNNVDVVVDKWTGRVIYSKEETEPTSQVVAIMNQNHEKRITAEAKKSSSTTVAATKTDNKAKA